MPSLGVVALFNSNPDAVQMIARLLESAGFITVTAMIPNVRDGRYDIEAMMRQHDPSVVVYDIGPPYADNWRLFQQLRSRPSLCTRRFVITAVNAGQVEKLAGRDERIFEVVDRQSDLVEIVHAVKEAARARSTRGDDVPSTRGSNVVPLVDRRVGDRRQSSWTSNDIYRKLREKREQVEVERRRGGRRATDPHHHAA